MHLADQGDTATKPDTLNSAAEHLNAVDATPTPAAPAVLIADKVWIGVGSRRRSAR
jgi:hypothetical protein